MPKGYSEVLPCFFANLIESIESHLDTFWSYMESLGVEHEDVYMRALGESLGGNVDFWLYMLALGSITGYDMFTKLLREEGRPSWGRGYFEFHKLGIASFNFNCLILPLAINLSL